MAQFTFKFVDSDRGIEDTPVHPLGVGLVPSLRYCEWASGLVCVDRINEQESAVLEGSLLSRIAVALTIDRTRVISVPFRRTEEHVKAIKSICTDGSGEIPVGVIRWATARISDDDAISDVSPEPLIFTSPAANLEAFILDEIIF